MSGARRPTWAPMDNSSSNPVPFDADQASRSHWAIIKPFWFSEAKSKAWGLLASVVALDLVSVWLLVVFTTLRKTIYDGLEHYQQDEFMAGIAKFFAAACFFILLAVYKQYLRQQLEILWRGWLTKACLASWMTPMGPARLEALHGADNPDQRVSEDAATVCQLTLSLGLGLLSSVVTLGSFFGLLWGISGPLDFEIAGFKAHIPGYMAWVAILYAAIGSALNHMLGRRLVRQTIEQQRREADLRYSMMRTRESAEAIALIGGERAEQRRAFALFEQVRANYKLIMSTTKRVTGFSVGYSQVAALFPLIVAAPRYFSKAISLGDLMQISSAFGQVEGSLSWFIDSYGSWVAWHAACERLRSMFESIKTANAPPALRVQLRPAPPRGPLAADHLILALPGGAPLLDASALRAEPGSSVLIQGPSGSGKSALLKAIAGLWLDGSGSVDAPLGSMFIPQKPFLPPGSIEDALCYPEPSGAHSAEKIIQALLLANLPLLAQSVGSGALDWQKILSGGEAQRVGFARAFLAKPAFLFLDEATSAQDEENEERLMRALRQALPDCSILSVGHRSALRAHHDATFLVQPASDGSRQGVLSPTP